jgi:hypothetical protein
MTRLRIWLYSRTTSGAIFWSRGDDIFDRPGAGSAHSAPKKRDTAAIEAAIISMAHRRG